MLTLIDLDIKALGFEKFISSWLYQSEKGAFVVDPGPACTLKTLLSALKAHHITQLDWILLTHIHLDHAGGTGDLIEQFPKARVVCHEKGFPHLIDPERLWQASLKVLGHVAQTYGKAKPVPEKNLFRMDRIPFGSGIEMVPTPGHAAHHLSPVFENWIFCGELLGVFHALDNGYYLRPATPPRFIPEEYLSSMDRIAPYADRQACFAHYGVFPDGREILSAARSQLALWVDRVKSYSENPNIQDIINDLIEQDHLFNRIKDLPGTLMQQEMFFVKNSIEGILDFVRQQSLKKPNPGGRENLQNSRTLKNSEGDG